jgi:peroxiredoxin
MCTFRDLDGAAGKADAQVYGISVDTRYAQAESRDQQQLNFPLLSDFNRGDSRYGVFSAGHDRAEGDCQAGGVQIDKDGVVRHREVLEDARNEPDYRCWGARFAGGLGTGTGDWVAASWSLVPETLVPGPQSPSPGIQ